MTILYLGHSDQKERKTLTIHLNNVTMFSNFAGSPHAINMKFVCQWTRKETAAAVDEKFVEFPQKLFNSGKVATLLCGGYNNTNLAVFRCNDHT